jgi:NAD(P)-dependent dehydrogenase (short-subunit alcohol dehydrogenase family)
MKTVVVTGSTRGIGHGLADAFLARGCCVVVSSRRPDAVEAAVTGLSAKHEPQRVFGQPCDVRRFEQVQALWDAARARFGSVHIWINNAGIGQAQIDFWDQPPAQIEAIIRTNVLGAMYGARVALAGMRQQGFGSLYNMEGLGSDGRRIAGQTVYGCTKCGLRYLTDALAAETKGTPIRVGALQPGMVVTDLLVRQREERPEDWEQVKRVFNILADRVETVTPWLAEKVLANDRNGVRIRWLSRYKAIGRFLSAPFRRRDLFA